MSNGNETQTALKTPEEWCQIEGVQILDADGWRGRDGRDWNDPISLAEFQERLVICTMRHVVKTPQPAGEQHTGSLNLTGEGNEPGSPISDEMIEQAAKAACEFVYPPKTHRAWEDVDDFEQASWRATASVLLLAAYPAIRLQVAEEIAVALERCDDHDARLIQTALDTIPTECRYHGRDLEWGLRPDPCCDTGKPSLYRRDAEAALKRARGAE